MNRLDFLKGSAAFAATGALGGCRLPGARPLTAYDDDLIDRSWMWGHASGQVDGPDNCWKLDVFREDYPMTAGARAFGLHNLNVIRWGNPPLDWCRRFAGMKRLTWPMCGHPNEKNGRYEDMCEFDFRLLEELPNLMGFELDDYFFNNKDPDVPVMTPKGPAAACPSNFPYETLAALRRRMDAYGRPLDLRLVFYDGLLDRKNVKSYVPAIDLATTVTYWTWCAKDTDRQEVNFRRYRELAPGKPTFLGVYLYDFGGERHMPVGALADQLAFGLEKFRAGEIEGFVFLCSSLCNRDYPAVGFCRDWIRAHKEEKWRSA